MTYDLDRSIGLLRSKIAALGISDRTYLVVMSDNGANVGGPRHSPSSGAILNAGKGSLYEGGIRVPFFVAGPDIEAGAICRVSITGCDLFPTFCDWAGTKIPNGLEGCSLAALIAGKVTELPERSLLFHYPHYGQGPRQKPQSALILAEYKILYDWESQTAQLFNLNKDLGEQTDLYAHQPEKSAAMLAVLSQRLNNIDAQLPQPNPNYDPNATSPTRRSRK
jgi:arylsulfatase A-like enzyme